MCIKLSPLAMSIGLALFASHMATAAETETDSAELESITVTASADASAEGLSSAFAGGQVAEGDVQVFWGLKIIWIHLLVLPAIPTNLFRTVRRRASETSCKPILVSGSLAALVTFRKPTSFEVFFFIQMMLPTMDCILCYPVNISRQSYLNALKYCVVPQHFLQVPLRVGTVSVALLIYS